MQSNSQRPVIVFQTYFNLHKREIIEDSAKNPVLIAYRVVADSTLVLFKLVLKKRRGNLCPCF